MNEQTGTPGIDILAIRQFLDEGNIEEAYVALTLPLHEQLYKQQTFDLLDELPVGERVALAFDYIRTQVDSGGFIQLIQNGYVSLLLTTIEGLQEMKVAPEMAIVLDDVLKVYVLNIDTLSKETSVDEFARLYNEFKEFDVLEERFEQHKQQTLLAVIDYCINMNK